LKQYAEWFRYFYPAQATEEDNADKAAEHEAGDGSKPRNGIKSRWEKYKKEFAATQVSHLFFYQTHAMCMLFLCLYNYLCVLFVEFSEFMTELSCIVASNDV